MAETRNKCIQAALYRERLENARRYWEAKRKAALSGGMGRAPCPSQTADDVPGTN